MNQIETPTNLPAQGAGFLAAVRGVDGGKKPLSDAIYDSPEAAEASARRIIEDAAERNAFASAFIGIGFPFCFAVMMAVFSWFIVAVVVKDASHASVALLPAAIGLLSFGIFIRNLNKAMRDGLVR